MKTRLLLDCNYLCHRAFHTFGELSHADVNTGVVFGFLKDLIDLQDRFRPECFIFCFDSRKSIREKLYPGYKSTRKERYKNPAEAAFKKIRDKQTKDLRLKHLPSLGYKNIFCFKGYEADDIIATVVKEHNDKATRLIIVSNDHDLYQLLSKNVGIYKPTKHIVYGLQDFIHDFGVEPSAWADVKAIAGCGTDDVDGIDGIGEKTAARYISGNLPIGGKLFDKITKGNEIWRRNLMLVRLPLPGMPELKIHSPEEMKRGSWRHLASKLGMWSIHDKEPKQKPRGFGLD